MATAVDAGPLLRRDYKPSVPPSSSSASSAAPAQEAEPPSIIVDRTTNVTYMRGKFLGKVQFTSLSQAMFLRFT